MKKVNVVAGIIIFNNKILCVQRPLSKFSYISYKWEFPGGKIEEDESEKQALHRELKEELELNIEHFQHFMSISHTYPDFQLNMSTFLCRVSTDGIVRKEHVDHVWLDSKELHHLDWAEADLPIVKKIMEEL